MSEPTQMNAKTKNRCHQCNKKIPLVMRGTPCQCGFEFCALHRLPESHDCGFDHREKHLSTAESKINAMKCVAEKIEKV